jgi:hypothetical protein
MSLLAEAGLGSSLGQMHFDSVTPEVAGSSPVAPAPESRCKSAALVLLEGCRGTLNPARVPSRVPNSVRAASRANAARRGAGASFGGQIALGLEDPVQERPGRRGNAPGAGTGGSAPMQGNRNGGPPTRLPDPDSLQYRAQKVVLLELVVTPPTEGDRIDELTDRLCVPGNAIVPAIAALEVAGLANRNGDIARATAAALHFEHLWPVML